MTQKQKGGEVMSAAKRILLGAVLYLIAVVAGFLLATGMVKRTQPPPKHGDMNDDEAKATGAATIIVAVVFAVLVWAALLALVR